MRGKIEPRRAAPALESAAEHAGCGYRLGPRVDRPARLGGIAGIN
jgi:hypothetical protein